MGDTRWESRMSTMEDVMVLEEIFDDVPPDASAMVESMRAHGYTLSTAIADLVDNSIAASCRNVWLRFEWDENASWVSVTDDGTGMSEAELRSAMRLGSQSPVEERDVDDLGRFGLGLKTASFSQARRLTVISRTGSGQDALRRWDLDHLAKPEVKGWQLLKTAHQETGDRIHELDRKGLGSGTQVLLEILDRVLGSMSGDDSSRTGEKHFVNEVAKVREHLEMVFHRFLADRSAKGIKIFLNEEQLKPWDPFIEDNPATQPFSPENFPADAVTENFGEVKLKGFVLPHKDRFDDADSTRSHRMHAQAGGPAGWNAQQGFYLYRNRRLIVAGDWLGLGPGRNGWKKEEHYKLARIRVDIPNSMDQEWQIDVKKSTALAPPVLRSWLQGLAKTVRERAKDVYSHRGSYGPRTPSARNEHADPWVCKTRRGGAFSYRIDRKNPVLKALIDALPPDDEKRLETLLRLVEETVPVQRIWVDTAENQDGVAGPFEGEQSNKLRDHIRIAYEVLLERGDEHTVAWQKIQNFPAFQGQDAAAIIAVLMEEGE
jgi:hypothetical protein